MEGSGKAAKKNKKRKAKKTTVKLAGSDMDAEVVLAALGEQLDIAKQNKDHAKASTLREQIWVLTDIVAGVKTDIPEEQLVPILESLPLGQRPAAEQPTHEAAAFCGTTDKRLSSLQKKLQRIEALKLRQENGETLEANQITKIDREESVRKEMKEIEDIIASIQITR